MHVHMYAYLREYIACASSSKIIWPLHVWVGGDKCATIVGQETRQKKLKYECPRLSLEAKFAISNL